jgi:hypothetical protein
MRSQNPSVQPKDVSAAIESAYAGLPDVERAEIDGLVDALLQALPRRGIGPQSARQILGALGIYLVEHPRIRVRLDGDGRFVGFDRESLPWVSEKRTNRGRNEELERVLRFFGSGVRA